VVLGGRADHARPADVDVLDRLVERHARLAHRLLERVEVDADQVDRLDAVLAHGGHVLGVVAQGEQAAVDLRVQRLDAAVHHLREAGDVGDVGDRELVLAEKLRGPAGADQLDVELVVQRAGELQQAGLVGH
jgi:hypothetical protein